MLSPLTEPIHLLYWLAMALFCAFLINSLIHWSFRIPLAKPVSLLIVFNILYCLGVALSFTRLLLDANAVLLLSFNGVAGGLTFSAYAQTLISYFGLKRTTYQWFLRVLHGTCVGSFIVGVVACLWPNNVVRMRPADEKLSEVLASLFPNTAPVDWAQLPVALMALVIFVMLIKLVSEIWKFRTREPLLILGLILSLACALNDVGIGMGLIKWQILLMPLGYVLEIGRFQWNLLSQVHRRMDRYKYEVDESRRAQNSIALVRLLNHDFKKVYRRLKSSVGLSEVNQENLEVLGKLIALAEESSSPQREKVEYSVLHVWEQVVRHHQDDFQKSEVQLIYEIENETKDFLSPREEYKLFGLPDELFFVYSNLIINSIQNMESASNKWLRVNFTSTSEKIRIRLSDSGRGFSPEERSMLFKLPTTKSSSGGRGVGLIIVQELLLRNQGFIELLDGPITEFEIQLMRGKSS